MAKIEEALIESAPFCKDGKKWVRKLLENLGHEIKVKVEEKIEVYSGQVWKTCACHYLLVNLKEDDCGRSDNRENLTPIYINGCGAGKSTYDLEYILSKNNKLANSLEEYYAKTAKGEL